MKDGATCGQRPGIDASVARAGSGGHTTRRNAAIGPRKTVSRNQYHGDRFLVLAKPPARIANVIHMADAMVVRVATSCMARH
jgi:hypothetical protein